MPKTTNAAAAVLLAAALLPSSQAFGDPQHRCTNAPAVSGTAWQQFQFDGKPVKGMFFAQATCPSSYKPVSGGIRYEGVWNDPKIGKMWQQVVSTPYDETANQEALAWRCMVTTTDNSDTRPDPLWCTAVCCRWD